MSKKKLRIIGEQKSPYVEDASGNLQYRPEVRENKRNHLALSIGAVVIILAAIFIGVFAAKERPIAKSFTAYPVNTELPSGVDEGYIKRLKDFGFTNTKELREYSNIIERRRWKKEHGLPFIGDDEMEKFLNDNSFIIGPKDRYIGDIPPSAGYKMMQTFNDIKYCVLPEPQVIKNDEIQIFGNPSSVTLGGSVIRIGGVPAWYRGWVVLGEILIIAAKEKFNTEGMQIDEGILHAVAPLDPIAVMKVHGGYVELAHW